MAEKTLAEMTLAEMTLACLCVSGRLTGHGLRLARVVVHGEEVVRRDRERRDTSWA